VYWRPYFARIKKYKSSRSSLMIWSFIMILVLGLLSNYTHTYTHTTFLQSAKQVVKSRHLNVDWHWWLSEQQRRWSKWMLFIHVFQCDRSLKSVVRLDQKHTTAIEWICHSLVRARSNIVREYQIHMFNHRMADISIGWRTRGAYCGDNTMNEYWSLSAPNKFSKSQYTSQFVICSSPLLR